MDIVNMGKNQQGAHYKRMSMTQRSVDALYEAVASGAEVLITITSSAFRLG